MTIFDIRAIVARETANAMLAESDDIERRVRRGMRGATASDIARAVKLANDQAMTATVGDGEPC